MNKFRVRFAPSPTGFLHIGGLRTLLYDYILAKKEKGTLVLRIEDTDQSRKVEGAVESLLQTIDAVGLSYDEGLNKEGSCGPYVQSERLDLYKKSVQDLIDAGKAYYAFDTPEELEAMRAKQQEAKQAPIYDRDSMVNQPTVGEDEAKKRVETGSEYVVRLMVPEGREVVFNDLVRGEIKISTDTIDDQIILKSDGFPTYHLASVVDDHYMEISHVVRGEEWISSTPKHILLYEAFGWDIPEFGHLPLLLNPDRSKLSKRVGDVSVESYLSKGYLPEALLNFVVLLGWNPKTEQEVMTLDEMIDLFSMSAVHKAGAVVDIDRLNWFNAQHIKRMDDTRYLEMARDAVSDIVGEAPDELINAALLRQKERISLFSELPELCKLYFDPRTDVPAESYMWKKSNMEDTKKALELAKTHVESLTEEQFADQDFLNETFQQLVEDSGFDNGTFYWPLRYALSGEDRSPGPTDLLYDLGKEESLRRLNDAQDRLNKA